MLVHFHNHTVDSDILLRKRRLPRYPIPAHWNRYTFSSDDLRVWAVEAWIERELVGKYAVVEGVGKDMRRFISVFLENDTDMVMFRLKGAEAALVAEVPA